jgi:hypothetical protein
MEASNKYDFYRFCFGGYLYRIFFNTGSGGYFFLVTLQSFFVTIQEEITIFWADVDFFRLYN